jgi:thiosulfate/3-mercaptopyruvate sulfurtransferase
MARLGIREQDHVVVYTHSGAMSGPRVWYLFTAFGHKKVSLLQGGIAGWRKIGGNIATMTADDAAHAAAEHALSASLGSRPKAEGSSWALKSQFVATKEDVHTAMLTGNAQILDARAAAR